MSNPKPRKVHKKSRYGCDNCRRRRVKCDELGPPCTNCISRAISDCTYSRVLPASLLANARRESGDVSNTALLSSPNNANAVDELELMHHFATETYQSLCLSKSESRTWQVLVPQLALKRRYLMHGILSLASLHLATMRDASEARPYIDAGLSHHSLSLEPFRIAIGSLTPENCEAAFAQSIVTTAISLALPQLTSAHKYSASASTVPVSAPAPHMTDHILTIFELLQGVKKILTLGKPYITLQLFSQGSFWRKDSTGTLDASTADAFARLTALNESTISAVDLTQSQINANVIAYLRHCFIKFAVAREAEAESASEGRDPDPDPAPVLAWLGAVDPGFVESLRQRDRVSLLILAYWGILLMRLDGYPQRWWARGAGMALMGELMGVLGGGESNRRGFGGEWEGCLGWIGKRMEGEIERFSRDKICPLIN
ncbi:hypothetical protein BJX65DRAFT_316464 [Aspergillus insuetus]